MTCTYMQFSHCPHTYVCVGHQSFSSRAVCSKRSALDTLDAQGLQNLFGMGLLFWHGDIMIKVARNSLFEVICSYFFYKAF